MRGVITSRDVLSNIVLIWRGFGAGCAVRCLWAIASGRGKTFLEVAVRPEQG
jgi:hypothetical protein